ncbi:MAG TPA: hypothetical protein VFT57_07710 [Gemmatimonadaceae bacterium]|jgi:hypothetical protein|nr:hypothetical protein [Gemmatimonadaceae bacterium]
MTSDELLAILDAFFASYRSAFERGDAAAIAGHFGDTVHVATDTGSGVHLQCVDHAAWRNVIEQLVMRYRALDVGRTDVRALTATAISPRLAQARVGWRLYDGTGELLYEFTALYTLTYEERTCRIVALAHDEVARSR